jgi:hypothetical protein
MSPTSGRYPLLLAILFLGYWIVLAIEPRDRADWLLENLLAIEGPAFQPLDDAALPRARTAQEEDRRHRQRRFREQPTSTGAMRSSAPFEP